MKELGEWFSEVERGPCSLCILTHQDRGIPTPCDTCFPGVHKYNETAVKVYLDCSSQYLYGPMGAITLDLRAATLVFDWYEIPQEDRPDLWEKINIIADALIVISREDAERKAKIEANKKR